MGIVVDLEARRCEWDDLFTVVDKRSTLECFINKTERIIDIVQTSDEGESITTQISCEDIMKLASLVSERLSK